jgi:CubicO group peptidase (beta-lactamase class C family)
VFSIPVARSELDGLVAGSGGVISTAQDMSRWLVMQSNGGRADGATVLDASGIDLMHTPPAGIDTVIASGRVIRIRSARTSAARPSRPA